VKDRYVLRNCTIPHVANVEYFVPVMKKKVELAVDSTYVV
jgi:hypothetical protein